MNNLRLSQKYAPCFIAILFLLGIATGCHYANRDTAQLMSIQIFDRNGFRETITSVDRLKVYEKTDFTAPQPYQKVVRMYSREKNGKTPSRMTTYHENGEICQYLEVMSGRACGTYREWHPNGTLHLSVTVIEGLGDFSKEAQLSWIFDGICRIWDDRGRLEAEINYEKGLMQGMAFYYFANGKLKEQIPYEKNQIHGDVLCYHRDGHVIGKTHFVKGKKEGLSTFKGDSDSPEYSEFYRDNLLMKGIYYDFSKNVTARIEGGYGKRPLYKEGRLYSLEEYQGGVPQGKVELYDERGQKESSFMIKDGMKHGLEKIYYPAKKEGDCRLKLSIHWVFDQIHGMTRTWFRDGTLESEREMHKNQKQGLSSAWYADGSLRLIEEYDHDQLISGKYFKKGDSAPVSVVDQGSGVVTLYDADGMLMKQITYEKGQPVLNEH